VTRPVIFEVELNGFTKDPFGGCRAGLSASAEISRAEVRRQHQPPYGGRRSRRWRQGPDPSGCGSRPRRARRVRVTTGCVCEHSCVYSQPGAHWRSGLPWVVGAATALRRSCDDRCAGAEEAVAAGP
jgi:hypothetical protein